MKKLVKTAKQQFEESRNELVYRYQYELCETETYYAYEDSKGHFYIFREQDGEYKELRYNQQYEALVFGERFLSAMSERFAEHNIPVKPLFDWYASADHDEEPFNLLDIYMCELESEHFTFEDIYEEVPDVRIVTAKEQWEKDSKYAKVLVSSKDITLKVCVTDESVIFYRSDDIFSRATYPSLNEMRQDAMFVGYITENLNEASMSDDIAIFSKWVRIGGDFPLPLSVVYHSEYQNYKYEEYEDKEEQPIEKNDFLSEIYELRDKMVEHIKDLCEQGMTIDLGKLLECTFLLWDDMSYVRPEELPDFWLAKNKFGVWMAYRSGDGGCEYELYDFSIETLQHIINCLH